MAKGEYETFDSGSGPVIADSEKSKYANRDSEDGLSAKDEQIGEQQVPAAPLK